MNWRGVFLALVLSGGALLVGAPGTPASAHQHGNVRNEDRTAQNCSGPDHVVVTDTQGIPRCLHADADADAEGEPSGTSEPVEQHEWTWVEGDVVPRTDLCIGDGTSGSRFLVMYGYQSGTASNYNSTTIKKIRDKLGYADAYLMDSDGVYTQRIRYVCSDGVNADVVNLGEIVDKNKDGKLDYFEIDDAVQADGYTTATDNSGSGTIRGINHNRNYIVFADNTDTPYGGAAYIGGYDNTSPDTRGGIVADIRKWRGETVLHEIMHTVGAVQSSAPRNYDGGHCKDELDILCNDGLSSTNYCPNAETYHVDCGHNKVEQGAASAGEDYWDPSGGQYYLANYWNTSKSYFFKPPVLK